MKEDIRWMDGKPAEGKFIMKIVYDNGSMAYMKSDTYEGIVSHYNLMIGFSNVVDASIYGQTGEYLKAA